MATNPDLDSKSPNGPASDTSPRAAEGTKVNGIGGAGGAPNKALDDVLYSDIGINILLNRLKQSIASARDFAAFLKKRSILEEEHAQGLRKLSQATHQSAQRNDNRQGSYALQLGDVTRTHDRMAENGLQFALSLHQMHEDLTDLSNNVEGGRKRWKHEGLDNEKKVKDAEALLEKAKARYDANADNYDRARTGDSSGRVFGIKGPKSAEQREEDLLRKAQAADVDYQAKVKGAQDQRSENLSVLRPQAVKAIQELIAECDSGLTLQLQKFAAFNEKLLVSNGMVVSPVRNEDEAVGAPSMREMIQRIDNDRDFETYVRGHTSSLPPRPAEIRYEKHPAMGGSSAPPPQQPPPPSAATQSSQQASLPKVSQPQPQPPPSSEKPPQIQIPSQPSSPAASRNVSANTTASSNPASAPASGPGYQSGRQQTQDRSFRGPPSAGSYSSQQGPPSQQQQHPHSKPMSPPPGQSPSSPYSSYNKPPGSAGSGGPSSTAMGAAAGAAGAAMAHHGRGPPSTSSQPAPGPPGQSQGGPPRGPNGQPLPPYNRVFGVSLEELFRRDDSAVPMVVYQCIQAVDLFGLEMPGIYRQSGSAGQVNMLKAQFDHDPSRIDFRNPSTFAHDVNAVATLLKLFLRDLPDPLLTSEHYSEFIEAARVDDDTARRDSLHAIINSLPDPNYATLRALVLHLHRVVESEGVNRMGSGNLAVCFAPTMMGPHQGAHMADAGLQVRVVDTIVQNTYQIFDED